MSPNRRRGGEEAAGGGGGGGVLDRAFSIVGVKPKLGRHIKKNRG